MTARLRTSSRPEALSERLLRDERDHAERRLASVRVVVLAGVTGLQVAFTAAAPASDRVVMVRAVVSFLVGTAVALAWWWGLKRLGVFRHAAFVSTTLDVALVAAVILDWTVYPGGVVLPAQLQFGVGYALLLGVLVLTSLRFNPRAVLLATAEAAGFYLGLAVWLTSRGAVRFAAAVADSYGPQVVNAIDFAGRMVILASVGLLLAWLNGRVEDLLAQSVEITRQKQRLGQFVSTPVAHAIESGEARLDLTGQRRRVAILFCDIRGFTRLSEALTAEALLTLLNDYYEIAAAEVFRHQGTLDKYLGDGFMALFGAPTTLANPSEAAVTCALALLEKIRAFHPEGVGPVAIGVGIHADEVVVGNLGTEAYKSYTAIGRGVNLAARIESATAGRGGGLLVSGSVRAELDGRFEIEAAGTFELKGIAEPQVLFTVCAAAPGADPAT